MEQNSSFERSGTAIHSVAGHEAKQANSDVRTNSIYPLIYCKSTHLFTVDCFKSESTSFLFFILFAEQKWGSDIQAQELREAKTQEDGITGETAKELT